jgi:hypothetical protein
MNLYLLIGQDWLEIFVFQLQIPSLGVTLPAYSETSVRVPIREKGNRLVEARELQENIFRASSVIECVGKSKCHRTNIQTLSPDPSITQINGTFQSVGKCEWSKRNQEFQSQL